VPPGAAATAADQFCPKSLLEKNLSKLSPRTPEDFKTVPEDSEDSRTVPEDLLRHSEPEPSGGAAEGAR
jgi:hypothetical protein